MSRTNAKPVWVMDSFVDSLATSNGLSTDKLFYVRLSERNAGDRQLTQYCQMLVELHFVQVLNTICSACDLDRLAGVPVA